jgi:ribosomal-protein-alanine N-acetyltransferase
MPGDDIDRIMAIMQCAFAPEFGEAWNRRQVEDALLIGNCHYILAGPDGEPLPEIVEPDYPSAGFALSRAGFEEEELLLFAVAPAYRQRGIGKRMLQRFADAARNRGNCRLLLEMRSGNPAESLYRAFGFVPIGLRPKYYRTPNGDRIDAITFAKSTD